MKKFVKLAFSSFIALIILSIITFFYDYSGVHIENKSGATDYTWEPEQFYTTMKEGHAFLKMDSDGFNNTINNKNNIDVLVMGSSHMEAVNISQEENLGVLLNKKNEERHTYNIGMSGHNIYRVVNNLDNALEYYQPEKYVIIETDRVKMMITDMKNVLSASYSKIPSYDSGLIYYIQKYIPAIKTIFNNLSLWNDQNKVNNTQQSKELIKEDIDEYERVLDKFVKKIKIESDKNDVLPIIVFHPDLDLDENGHLIDSKEELYLNLLNEISKKYEVVFIDMTSNFEQLYYEEYILPHGFSNTAYGEGHLNEKGHELLAQELTDFFNSYEE